MKSEWKNYNGVKYRRYKETETGILIEYNGGIGGYAKGEYDTDEDFIKASEKHMTELLHEIEEQQERFRKFPEDEQEKTRKANETLFERWQSEWGYDDEE